MATIYGTFILWNGFFNDDYDDTLVGTSRSDTIYGLGGDDEIWAGAGIDVVYGGDGNDVIYLEDPDIITPENNNLLGPEEAYGQDGNDQIYGGSNDDVIEGGDGLDLLCGGGGNDTIHGGDDTDWILGEEGADILYGDGGFDWLYGGDGGDVLYGGEGNDWLDGGPGNDILVGGDGPDWLTGGSGWDTFEFVFENWFVGDSFAFIPDTITDFSATDDHIDLQGPGFDPFPKNKYVEYKIDKGVGYDTARLFAESFLLNGDKDYAFVTDQVDGYLFVDWYQGEYTPGVEVGIILKGLTSVDDFDWNNIM